VLAAVATVLLGAACGVSDAANAPPPTPEMEPVFQPVPLASPTATPEPLRADEVEDALRAIVCWYDDPDLARECLPPGQEALEVLRRIALSGDERFIAPLVDMLWLEVGWERWVREALEQVSSERFATVAEWYAWIAAEPPPLPDGYGEWKGRLLSVIDPRFSDLIHEDAPGAVPPHRLIWAHVGPGDIPALVEPDTVHRVEERYLGASDRVFGVVVDGVARAYPERIIAWHGAVHDVVNGRPIVVWHCVPCGGAAVFENTAGLRFGMSGLALDSRRLFFDEGTHSLWDPVTGWAVHGPQAEDNASLRLVNSIRTTWSEWAARYPNTRVLSLDTGYVRDYAPGAALLIDDAAERPMFPVAELDERHEAKRRVLGVSIGGERKAYDLVTLEAVGVLRDVVGGQSIVILSAGSGRGATVYAADGTTFVGQQGTGVDREVVDDEEIRWFVDDERLLNSRNSRVRSAVPSQVAYWFAWSGAYPETALWAP
jgi:hypothetical protein